MRECLQCGKPLPRTKEKGHREREYCSDVCRQRAWRQRNKWKHDLGRIIQASNERMWNAIDQHVHREHWQDELEQQEKLLELQDKRFIQIHKLLEESEEENRILQAEIQWLKDQLAEKEAEIVRVATLLESQSNRKRSGQEKRNHRRSL